MKNDKYQEIINRLKDFRPGPDDPLALTALVMKKVEACRSHARFSFRLFKWYVRPIMTAAAVFLLFLLVHENRGKGFPETGMNITGTAMAVDMGHDEKVKDVTRKFIKGEANNCQLFSWKAGKPFPVQQAFDCYLQYQKQKQAVKPNLKNKVQAIALRY